jgi:hypothetical protein
MEMRIGFQTSHGGISNYAIGPARLRAHSGPIRRVYHPADLKRMSDLAPRIRQMARAQLGKAFVQLLDHGWFLELRIKQGTSKNPKTKAKLQRLFGWICLFDVKEKKVIQIP